VLFFFCIGRDPYNLPVAVFNQDHNDANYSLDYLRAINNYTILQRPVESFEEGILSIKNGKNRALITIGANFSDALIQRSVDGYFAEEKDINMSKVNLYLDMTSELLNNK